MGRWGGGTVGQWGGETFGRLVGWFLAQTLIKFESYMRDDRLQPELYIVGGGEHADTVILLLRTTATLARARVSFGWWSGSKLRRVV